MKVADLKVVCCRLSAALLPGQRRGLATSPAAATPSLIVTRVACTVNDGEARAFAELSKLNAVNSVTEPLNARFDCLQIRPPAETNFLRGRMSTARFVLMEVYKSE